MISRDRGNKGRTLRGALFEASAPAKEAAEPSPLERLLGELGSGARCKVFRAIEGEARYAFTTNVDDGFADNLEETLAKRVGGGQFWLRFYQGSKYIAPQITVVIDESVHPQVKTQPEKNRSGEGGEAGAPTDMIGLMRWIDSRLERERLERERQAQQLQKPSAPQFDPMQLIAFMHKSQLEMAAVMRGPSSGEPRSLTEQLGQIKGAVDLVRGITGDNAGDGRSEQNRSMAERVLENPLTKLGERVGDRIADLMMPQPEKKQPAIPPVRKQVEDATRNQPVQPPANARKLTDEERKQMFAGRGAPQPTPAPKAADVLPHAVGKAG